MSILNKLKIQRETAREAVTQVKPQDLSRDVQSAVQQAGLQLVKNDISQARDAGHNGQTVKPQEWKQGLPTQGW